MHYTNKGLTFVGGIGLGAGLMYLLDPDRGKRRRALVRDKAVHFWNKAEGFVDKTSRHIGNRAYGLMAEAKSKFSSTNEEEVTDEVLVGRLKSELGRIVSHPSSIEITANQGYVTVSGPILASEAEQVLAHISSSRGVTGVENRLEVHERAETVPGLQGSSARPLRWNNGFFPSVPVLAVVAGCILAIYATNRRDDIREILNALGMRLRHRSHSKAGLRRRLSAWFT